jgi:hypothetical protein
MEAKMATSRKEVLELLSSGKITADEAANLLNDAQTETAAATEITPTEPVKAESSPEGGKPAWFRVRVNNLDTGKSKVTVNIPLRMLEFGLKIGKKFSPELDWNDFNGMVGDMTPGMLVDVRDEDSNEHVQVFIE